MHTAVTASKRIAHCKQNSRTHCKQKRNCKKICTLQAKEIHAANKTPARYKQERHCKKKLHTANKRITRCKLQTKAKVLRVQDNVKDWDHVSMFSWFTTNMAEFLCTYHWFAPAWGGRATQGN